LVPKLDPVGLELLEACLQANPALRPSAADLLTHPYLKDVPASIRDM